MRLDVRALACAVVVLTSVSCDDPAEPEIAPITRDVTALFQTDSLAYTMRQSSGGYNATIDATFTNRTSETAYFINCNGASSLRLDKLVAGAWEPVWYPVIPSCLSAPIVVGIGATHTTRIYVFGGFPGSNVYPQFSTPDIDGEYRLVFDVQNDPDPRSNVLFPFETRVSNRFRLTTAGG